MMSTTIVVIVANIHQELKALTDELLVADKISLQLSGL